MSIAQLIGRKLTMAYFKDTLVGILALFVATILYIVIAAYLALRNFTPPPGTEVGIDLSSFVNRPAFWLIALAAFALGFYWQSRRGQIDN